MNSPSIGDHSWSGRVTTAFPCASSTNMPGGACTRHAPQPMQRSRCIGCGAGPGAEEHTSGLQPRLQLVCRLLLVKKQSTQTHLQQSLFCCAHALICTKTQP